MRATIAFLIFVMALGGRAWGARPRGEPATSAATPTLPTEAEYTGCKRHPAEEKFKMTLRGEVSLADLVAVVGAVGCRGILVGPGVAAKAGKVSLELPDLVSAP